MFSLQHKRRLLRDGSDAGREGQGGNGNEVFGVSTRRAKGPVAAKVRRKMMIFQKTYQQVLDGTKTQTRRVVNPGDRGLYLTVYRPDEITHVINSKRKTRWAVLADYAVQPGQGKKAVGRIRITKIRRERLQEISKEDLRAELGCDGVLAAQIFFFNELWNSLYHKPCRWEQNPEVWALEFELV